MSTPVHSTSPLDERYRHGRHFHGVAVINATDQPSWHCNKLAWSPDPHDLMNASRQYLTTLNSGNLVCS